MRWYRKAAEQGHADAQNCLGLYYDESGDGPGKAESVMWYRAAAEQGHADAQFNLGLYYFYNGTDIAKKKAMMLFIAAAKQGHRGVEEFFENLRNCGKSDGIFSKLFGWG